LEAAADSLVTVLKGYVLSTLMQVTNRDAHAQFYIAHDTVACPTARDIKEQMATHSKSLVHSQTRLGDYIMTIS
jgi:hypothetical protein